MSELLDVTKAAELTSLSVSWWRQAIFHKTVPVVRIGRRVFIDRRDLQKLIDSGRVEASGS